MVSAYYHMTFKEYKEHAPRLYGAVGHSMDEGGYFHDESEMIVKVTAEDHIHLYLEQHGFNPIPHDHDLVQGAVDAHPLLRKRG
jgi:hypothetical protein